MNCCKILITLAIRVQTCYAENKNNGWVTNDLPTSNTTEGIMGDMLSDAVAMSDAGKLAKDSVESTAQLLSLAALIYHCFKKDEPDYDYSVYRVANDWFEAVWEITPYEASQYGYDLCEAVYGRCIVDNNK